MSNRTPTPDISAVKCACLAEWEALSEPGALAVFDGDASGVSWLPNLPYAGQFAHEVVPLPRARGGHVNGFALRSRCTRCFAKTRQASVSADGVAEHIGEFWQTRCRLRVIVLDNARVPTQALKEPLAAWEARGLFIQRTGPISTLRRCLWKQLKYAWLPPTDSLSKDILPAAVGNRLEAVGKSLKIAFQPFQKPNTIYRTYARAIWIDGFLSC